MALEPLFNDICAAIHEKDGKTDGIMAQDFPTRIRAIPTGGAEPTGPGWHRPSNWPDYSKISLDGFEGMYFTYDTSRAASDPTEFCAFTVTTQGGAPYLVERGQIAGGEFVAEESRSVNSGEKFAEWLTQTESSYVVYRVTSEGSIARIQMSESGTYDGGKRTSSTQFCVERYGRLPNLTSISSWGLASLVSETILDVKSLTSIASCWTNCYSLVHLDLAGWDIRNITSMQNCWQHCASLSHIDLPKPGPAGNVSAMGCFWGCKSLNSLDLSGWITGTATNMTFCFYECPSLVDIDMSGLTVAETASMQNCFNCQSLMDMKFCPVYTSFTLSGSSNLTVSSLVNVLTNLPEVEEEQTVTIGAANKAKLTDDQIAIATAKNWVVA